MSCLAFDELFSRLRTHDESLEIEAKRASEVGRSIMETVCAFSNEPGRNGGYLLLGVERDEGMLFPDYEITGLANPEKIQNDLVSRCSSDFNTPVRPHIFPEVKDGRTVLVVHVPEAAPSEKPVYFKKTGLPKGAYRRIGASDQHCTEDDLAILYQGRTHATFEDTVLQEVDPASDFSPEAVNAYRTRRARANPSAEELGWGDAELFDALSATRASGGRVCATLCGLMAFGSKLSLRRVFPMARVDYVRVPGRTWIDNPDEPFETVEMRDSLLLLVPKVISTVLDDIPKGFRMDRDGIHRQDVPLIPERVIREVIVNALMHRNYRTRQPVQIIRYSNRIEITNPGCSLKPDDRLGEPGSVNRNEKLAAILHECNLAETKGSGIRVMRDLMDKANLTRPLFESDRDADTFAVTLLTHHFMEPADVEWLGLFRDCELTEDEARALVFIKEVGQIDNAVYRDINRVDTLTASGHLRKLRNHGLLEQQGRGSGTYYVPGKRLSESLPPNLAPLSGNLGGLSPNLSPLSPNLGAEIAESAGNATKLPLELVERVEGLGRRCSPEVLDALILDICAFQPITRAQLASVIRRSEEHIRECLRRMVNNGRLQLLFPDTPNHPEQKYVVAQQSPLINTDQESKPDTPSAS